MLILVRMPLREIFDLAGPSCVVEGVCKEAHSCNEPYENMGEDVVWNENICCAAADDHIRF